MNCLEGEEWVVLADSSFGSRNKVLKNFGDPECAPLIFTVSSDLAQT